MSARELLRQVKALSARERERFVDSILAIEEPPLRAGSKSQDTKWPDVEARAKRILGRKVLPNLVLLEREEEGH